MNQPPTVNPDDICRRAVQARMATYEALELFGSVMKGYNDQVAALVNLVGMMKERILELEKPQGTVADGKESSAAAHKTQV